MPRGPTSWANVRVRPTTPSFAAAVWRSVRKGLFSRHRADVDDLAVPGPLQVGEGRLAGEEHPRQVHRDRIFPLFEADVDQGCRRSRDAGVVHKDVEDACTALPPAP